MGEEGAGNQRSVGDETHSAMMKIQFDHPISTRYKVRVAFPTGGIGLVPYKKVFCHAYQSRGALKICTSLLAPHSFGDAKTPRKRWYWFVFNELSVYMLRVRAY